MTRQWDDRSEEAGLNMEMRLWKLAGQVKEIAEEMERDLGRRIRDGRPWTASSLTGTPSVANIVWDHRDEQPIGHVEAVPASAMIPPRQLNRADRGAE